MYQRIHNLFRVQSKTIYCSYTKIKNEFPGVPTYLFFPLSRQIFYKISKRGQTTISKKNKVCIKISYTNNILLASIFDLKI